MPAQTANQALFDASVRHQVHLLRFAEGEARRAASILQQTEGELLEKIASYMARGADPTRLEGLLTDVKKLRAQVYEQLGEDTSEALRGLAQAEAAWEVEALKGSSPIQLNVAGVPAEALNAVVTSPIAGLPLSGWLDDMSTKEATRLQSAITQGVLQGETIDEMVRRLRGTKAKNFSDGLLAISRRNAEALVRTSVNHVSNSARATVWDANADIVRAVRWTSTLDGRTSTICQARDGQMKPIGNSELFPGDIALSPPDADPPAHFNCRSLFVPILDGEEIAGDRPFVADKRTRAEREKAFRAEAKERGVPIQQVRKEWADANVGTLPASTTYQDWLRKQPKEFQDDLLGVGKAEIFRSGLPLARFVDKSGKSLTLTQLKAEIAGDALNVLQPGIGLKAKGLLMQGIDDDQVLKLIQAEFIEANTTKASIASYKSQLNKAGLLGNNAPTPASQLYQVLDTENTLAQFEESLPMGLYQNAQGEWATVVNQLDGHPGAYAHYKPGVGVELADDKLASLTQGQAQQVMAHELGHLLHKQHDIQPIQGVSGLKAHINSSPELKKLYGYYLASDDELIAEVIGQSLSDTGMTSQGVSNAYFKSYPGWDSIKKEVLDYIDESFPVKPTKPVSTGPVIPGAGEIPGKPTTIGGYAKALLQQGIADDDVLTAVLAEFPKAKTTKASIASYKSTLKKAEQNAIGKSKPVVASVKDPQVSQDAPPIAPAPDGVYDPAAKPPAPDGAPATLSGLKKVGSKPGGSNPGALYEDSTGQKWLVKGNLQKANGSQTLAVSNARAANEVMASDMLRTINKDWAPEMKLIDLEGEYGGGLGVMSKWDPDVKKLDLSNAVHKIRAQQQFAAHVMMANHDVIGASFDNLVIKGTKAVNIDPGGALWFRAQGVKKTSFAGGNVDEWTSMRDANVNAQAAKIFGDIDSDILKVSAAELNKLTDEVIDNLVDAYYPTMAEGLGIPKNIMAGVLKMRRDKILAKAGIEKGAMAVKPPASKKKIKLGTFEILPTKAQYLKDDLYTAMKKAGVTTVADLPPLDLADVFSDLGIIGGKVDIVDLDKFMIGVTDDLVEAAKPNTPILLSAPKGVKDLVDDMIKAGKLADPESLLKKDSYIANQVSKAFELDADNLVLPEDIQAYKAWLNPTEAVDDLKPVATAQVAPQAVQKPFKQMSAQELADTFIPDSAIPALYETNYAASQKLQQVAAQLFKTGIKTDTVWKALSTKFPAKFVPKPNSLASMKSKLKKQGLLEGEPVTVSGIATIQTPLSKPALWGKALGNKSSNVKEQAKQHITSGQSAEYTVDWIKGQFSTPNIKGAKDLYELAYYEVKTGKANKKPGVAAMANKSNDLASSGVTPVPLRPGTVPGDSGPPPPRFTPEHRREGLAKYGGLDEGNDRGRGVLNKRQKAAGLEELETEEFRALRNYTGGAYRRLNQDLRDGKFASNPHLQAYTDAAMSGAHKLPNFVGDVNRGMTIGSAETATLRKYYRPGAIVQENGFVSTSDVSKRKGFSGNFVFHIKSKTGVDVSSFSKHGGEAEVLLMPGTRFKVVHVDFENDAKTEIWMEEV